MTGDREAKALGGAIADARKAKGWSQEKLARLAEMSREGLRKIENGESRMPTKLPDIARALETTSAQLLGHEADNDNPYSDPAEREIWELVELTEEERREHIAILRARRGMQREAR